MAEDKAQGPAEGESGEWQETSEDGDEWSWKGVGG